MRHASSMTASCVVPLHVRPAASEPALLVPASRVQDLTSQACGLQRKWQLKITRLCSCKLVYRCRLVEAVESTSVHGKCVGPSTEVSGLATSNKLSVHRIERHENAQTTPMLVVTRIHHDQVSTCASCVQCGDASGTGVFDTANRVFDKERMSSIDSSLHTFFPDLIGPNDVSFPQAALSETRDCCPQLSPLIASIWCLQHLMYRCCPVRCNSPISWTQQRCDRVSHGMH